MFQREAIKTGLGISAFIMVLALSLAVPASPILEGGALLAIAGFSFLTAQDLASQRHKTENADNLIDADILPGALVVTTVNGHLDFLNFAARTLFKDSSEASHIRELFEPLHSNLDDRSRADQVIDAVLSAPDIQFTEMLYLRDGSVYERITKPADTSTGRIWILRDLTHVHAANDDSAMHRSMLEADAARTAELAEQLFHAKAELEAQQVELTRLANTDSLTGLLNRRRFTALGEEAVAKNSAGGQEICVLMMDIDYFKRINDTYGHAAGDVAIRDFAMIAERATDGKGFIGRMGGEEFAIILPATDLNQAIRIAETIRRETAQHQTVCDAEKFRYTASIGVAQWLPEEVTIEPALDRADQALYSAKTYGRNRVVGFEYARA